ncbi:MAG: hypothetical protein AB1403_00400 [Candidatus Riflebacteria bacterium]
MLIHIGQNEFVDFQHCESIFNLQTIDEDSRKRILAKLPQEHRDDYRAAILTIEGKWIGSTLSPEALAQRGICHPFQSACYLKEDWKTSDHYHY